MAIIELDPLTKRFDDIVAVDDLTLDIADGEFFGLLAVGSVAFRRMKL